MRTLLIATSLLLTALALPPSAALENESDEVTTIGCGLTPIYSCIGQPPCDPTPIYNCIGGNPCDGQSVYECFGITAIQEILREDRDEDNDGIDDTVEQVVCSYAPFRSEIESTGQAHCVGRQDWVVHPGTQAIDQDNDDIPDVLEILVCGPAFVQNNLGSSGHARCESSSNLVLDPDTSLVDFVVDFIVDTVVGTILEQYEQIDGDNDLVPDALESWVCQFENQNLPQDGTCDPTRTDYTPPA